MSNKKILAVTALALLLSQQSFASEAEGFYFGSGYYGQFFNNMGGFKAKIGNTDAEDKHMVSVDDMGNSRTESKLLKNYKPNYNPLFAGNIAFGYEGELNDNSYRVELEGVYSSVKVDDANMVGSKRNILYLREIAASAPESSTITQSTLASESTSKDQYGYGARVNHDIENRSVMANVYHYWKNDRFSFSPYVGAGIGVTKMKMFETTSIGPAYQLKAGLDYHINENVNMHVGYRHFGIIGGNFELTADELGKENKGTKKLDRNQHSRKVEGRDKITDKINISSGLFTTHGIEAGLTFHFASKA